jgi:hypothetical protein
VVNAIPRPLYPRERPGTRYRKLNGPQGRSGRTCPPPGFDPRTVQPVASICTVTLTRPSRVGTWSFILAGMWSGLEANQANIVVNLGMSGYMYSWLVKRGTTLQFTESSLLCSHEPESCPYPAPGGTAI